MIHDPNDSFNDLDQVYGRGAYAPQRMPLQNGGIGAPTDMRTREVAGPVGEGPEAQAERKRIEGINTATANYRKHGGNVVQASMQIPQGPAPRGPVKTDNSGDMGIIGPQSYRTVQSAAVLDRSGNVAGREYEASRSRFEEAKIADANARKHGLPTSGNLEAKRQEFEGYQRGTNVQLLGSGLGGQAIVQKGIPGRVTPAQEQALMPNLIEKGVNVPHRVAQGLSADKSTAEAEIAEMRSYQPYKTGNPTLAQLRQSGTPQQYRDSQITPDGVSVEMANPKRR